MQTGTITLDGFTFTVHSLNTVVVGTGAAGFSAADKLHSSGQEDIAIVTECMYSGTSRNAGSDKQTYYKLTLGGGAGDSVFEMAETLFSGGAMHGDTALVEAAMSAQCFYRLVELGVPFPHDRYGQYPGYKTDHDPRQRAVSAGPLTSNYMTSLLQNSVAMKGIAILDGILVIAVLTDPKRTKVIGLLALDTNHMGDPARRYVLFNCINVVFATGGPAGMYGASVYPENQTGATGIALMAGAAAANLTESQFGIASQGFRWNLSGTYQQVLPRYISTKWNGRDEREFLEGAFGDERGLLDAIFLKGYQWPFDVRKASGGGSSLIDLLVYRETVLEDRQVYLDYTRNPSSFIKFGGPDFSRLGKEARAYLEQSGALSGTPVKRLKIMNRLAYQQFRDYDIDLARKPLEIAVSAQHANGGLAVNIWWESNLRHFFPVGEAAGTHGVYRPGGSALNAGQVGSVRAAQYIARRYADEPPSADTFLAMCRDRIAGVVTLGERFLSATGLEYTVSRIRSDIRDRMDRCGGIIRSLETAKEGAAETKQALESLVEDTRINTADDVPDAFRNLDTLVCQYAYLSAIADYIEHGGKSRGSYIVTSENGELPAPGLPDSLRFEADDGSLRGFVQTGTYQDGSMRFEWEPVRPIPRDEGWFETIWRDFRDDKIIE